MELELDFLINLFATILRASISNRRLLQQTALAPSLPFEKFHFSSFPARKTFIERPGQILLVNV